MSEYGFSLTNIFPHKDKIPEKTGEQKPVLWYILRCAKQCELRTSGYLVLYKKLCLYNDLHEISIRYNSPEREKVPEISLFH